jgi:hypothetical protein
MKKLILILPFIFLSTILLSQNGIYRCNSQRFQDKNNPSKNADHNNAMIITVNVNDYTGGFILVSCPSEDISYKYDILQKLDTKINNERNSIYNIYDGRFNVENVQAPTKMIVFLIQDKGKNSFDVAVNNPDSGTITLYQNLNKITY